MTTINPTFDSTFSSSPSTTLMSSAVANVSCDDFKTRWSSESLDGIYKTTWHGKVIIQIVLASLVLIVNIIVIAALAKSWKKFQQNIYIFALNIVICDALLGLVYFANSVHHLIARDTNAKDLLKETEIFYAIKSSIFVSAELSSAGHTVLITLAFNRYVTAQLFKEPHKRVSKEKSSVLISRRKSWYLSAAVWLVSCAVFIVGLAWNCAKRCDCFIEQGRFVRNKGSYKCLNANSCSFLFPPMKSIYAGICGFLFLLALLLITIMCVVTIYHTGVLGSFLPKRCRFGFSKSKTSAKTTDCELDTTTKPQRKSSVQLAYLRNMTHFIFFVTLTYIVCRFPANMLLVIESMSRWFQSHQSPWIPVLAADILSLLALAHSLLNPIVYWFTLHRLNQAVRDLLDVCCFKTVVIQKGFTTNTAPSSMSAHLSTTEWSPDTPPITAPDNTSSA